MSLTELLDGTEYLQPQTKAAYRHALERFERYAGEDPARYTPAAIESFRDALRGHGLSPATVNKHVYAIRWAARRRAQLGAGADFAQGAEGCRNPARLHRRALTVDAVRAVLATCEPTPTGIRNRALIVTGLRTGLRVSELCRMDAADVAAGVVRGTGKGGKQLEAVIDPEAARALGDWFQVLAAHRQRKTGPVFRSIRQGLRGPIFGDRPISRVTAHRIVATHGAAAGVQLSSHLLRHTFVTWALEAGVPPWRVMRQTGQARLETLMKYAHDLRAAEDPVGGYLPSVL